MSNLSIVPKMTTKTDSERRDGPSAGQILLKFWPIVGAGIVALISIGGIYVKVDYIAESIKKNDQMFSNLNDRQNSIGSSLVELRGQVANISDSNARNALAIGELNVRVNAIADKQRWAPK